MSHNLSVRRLLPRSIADSLMVMYSSGTGAVPKGSRSQRNANLSTIMMHVDAIYMFEWMRHNAAPRSVFPIRMRFEDHLRRMDAIMWSVLRSQKLQKNGCRVSVRTRLFTDRPNWPGKNQ